MCPTPNPPHGNPSIHQSPSLPSRPNPTQPNPTPAFAGLPHPSLFLALSGFFLGLGNCLALVQTLAAAIDTVLVAWASDPDSLQRHRPAEYVHLLGAWRHYDDCHSGRRLVAGVVVLDGHGGRVGVEGSPAVIYSQGGGRVVRVSI